MTESIVFLTDPHITGLAYAEHNVRPEGVEAKGDCVTRAIVMATGLDYQEVWDELTRRKKGPSNKRGTASSGMPHDISREYLNELGWTYVSFHHGEKFTYENLPEECIVDLPGHYTYVKRGIVYDAYDCRGKRRRKLEGYYVPTSSIK
jgi:hypothetical protein